jgi:hypothetical protein
MRKAESTAAALIEIIYVPLKNKIKNNEQIHE